MSHITSSSSAGRAPCRIVIAAALVCAAAALLPALADAAVARVRWLPRDAASATHYAVYVREAGDTYVGTPQWTGNPVPAADGTLTANVTFTPAATGANYFAVVAVDSVEESALSGELPTGWPDPCRNDHCSAKTACDFSAKPDGSSCDDVSFCNGMETCRSGVCAVRTERDCADATACTVDACDETANACTHVMSPGCCPTCDAGDPCLADACAAGQCPTNGGTELALERMRFTSRRSGVKLSVTGRFPSDAPIDPSSTGATLELRDLAGAVLHSSTVGPDLFKSRGDGNLHRFKVSRAAADDLEMSLRRLDFRLVDASWVVHAQWQAPDLMDAFLEPSLSVVVRVGDACVRRMNATCDQRSARSSCG
jgi:hypothetical protein